MNSAFLLAVNFCVLVLFSTNNCGYENKWVYSIGDFELNWGMKSNETIALPNNIAIPYLKKTGSVQRYSCDSQSVYKGWIWENNRSTMHLKEGKLSEKVGFVISSK